MARSFRFGAWFLVALAIGPVPAIADEISLAKCAVAGVAAFSNRVHIRCANDVIGEAIVRNVAGGTPGTIELKPSFLALALTPQTESFATKVLTLGLAAKPNQTVTVWFRLSTTIENVGCLAKDCRELVGIELLQ